MERVDPIPRGIGQIHLTVADIDRSVAFYRDVLGLRFLFDVPAQAMAFLDCGGVRLYLGAAESPEFESRPLLYYTVDDVDTAYATATARGAESLSGPHVVHRTEQIELWMAFLRDPDGIAFALMAEVPVSTRSPDEP
jgi:catechol 2,3-dioxygenase-like lactoylglutathione lyase family enzyme